MLSFVCCCFYLQYHFVVDQAFTLPETNSSHLKMDGWNANFLLGWPVFWGYVSFRECTPKTLHHAPRRQKASRKLQRNSSIFGCAGFAAKRMACVSPCANIHIHSRKTNMDTQNTDLEKVTPFKNGMLDFWGVPGMQITLKIEDIHQVPDILYSQDSFNTLLKPFRGKPWETGGPGGISGEEHFINGRLPTFDAYSPFGWRGCRKKTPNIPSLPVIPNVRIGVKEPPGPSPEKKADLGVPFTPILTLGMTGGFWKTRASRSRFFSKVSLVRVVATIDIIFSPTISYRITVEWYTWLCNLELLFFEVRKNCRKKTEPRRVSTSSSEEQGHPGKTERKVCWFRSDQVISPIPWRIHVYTPTWMVDLLW